MFSSTSDERIELLLFEILNMVGLRKTKTKCTSKLGIYRFWKISGNNIHHHLIGVILKCLNLSHNIGVILKCLNLRHNIAVILKCLNLRHSIGVILKYLNLSHNIGVILKCLNLRHNMSV